MQKVNWISSLDHTKDGPILFSSSLTPFLLFFPPVFNDAFNAFLLIFHVFLGGFQLPVFFGEHFCELLKKGQPQPRKLV